MRMRRLALIAMTAGGVMTGVATGAEPPSMRKGPAPLETSCVTCHAQLDGAALEPTTHTAEDVHFQKGLSCHNCHGGNPAAGADGDPFAAHDEGMGFAGKPSRTSVPAFCAKCHADAAYMKSFDPKQRVDQLSEYLTSEHGRLVTAGDARAAVCIDCHGAHGILPVRDPRAAVHPLKVADTCGRCHSDTALMSTFGIRTDQKSAYETSVHAQALHGKGDLSAPTCNDCHGSHGAAPPGVQNVANVCGSCHGREATLFREIEAKRGLDLEACIQCVVCHSNHAVKPPVPEMLGVGPQSTCTGCHAEGEAGYAGAAKMADLMATLRARLEEADGRLHAAERAGVEVGSDQLALQAAHDSLVESRVLVHSFDIERFTKVSTGGIAVAEEGLGAARRAFDELRRRRIGLGLSLVVIAAVIAGIAMTIRRIEG